MITQFSFTPTITSEEIRETEYMRDKLKRIKELRSERNTELTAAGQETLGEYEQFEYYLLCNKICGVAHYNMQMKIVVETEEEYNAWMAEQATFSETIDKMQNDNAPEATSGQNGKM